MNLNEKIIKAIETDTDFSLKYEKRIISIYENASDVQNKLIDDIFISLTGYSLATLIKKEI